MNAELKERLRRVAASAPTLTPEQAALIKRLSRAPVEPVEPVRPERAA